jgi:hypothetical protein
MMLTMQGGMPSKLARTAPSFGALAATRSDAMPITAKMLRTSCMPASCSGVCCFEMALGYFKVLTSRCVTGLYCNGVDS